MVLREKKVAASAAVIAFLAACTTTAPAMRDQTMAPSPPAATPGAATTTPTAGTTTAARPTGTPGTAAPATAPAPTPGSFPETSVPPARGYHALVSVGESGVLLFGGFGPIPGVGQTHTDSWLLSPRSGWTELALDPTYPVADHGAFDGGSRRVVTGVDEIWLLDPRGTGWELLESDGPQPGPGSRTAYDAESDRVILFTDAAATWAYDHESRAWTRMNPALSPPRRGWGAMAYDAHSDRIVLFGGSTPSGQPEQLADTWAYDYNTDAWTEMSPEDAPSSRSYSGMAYDADTDRLILFGGASGAQDREDVFDDTWTYDYDGNRWTALSPASRPHARGWHALAYSKPAERIVLFGGGKDRNSYTAETWLFDPATDAWERFTPRE